MVRVWVFLRMAENKDEQIIMVVKNDKLFGTSNDGHFQGFLDASSQDFISNITDNYFFHRRGDAEQDYTLKQPISYCIIVNPKSKKIYTYKRAASKEAYGETRLYGNWSIGVGGHIEQVDAKSDDPLTDSLKREISEEVECDLERLDFKVLGYINDESNDVGKVHFGVLYVALTKEENILPKNAESVIGEFKDISEIEEICKGDEVDNWTRIAYEPLVKFLREF